MTLLNKARQNRARAIEFLQARQNNIFLGDFSRPERPKPFEPLHVSSRASLVRAA